MVSVLAGEEHGGPTISLGVVDVSARLEQCSSALLVTVLGREHERRMATGDCRLEVGLRLDQCASDLLKAKEGWALACGSGWARASASVAF